MANAMKALFGEAAMFARHYHLHNLTAIVDHNHMQAMGDCTQVMDLLVSLKNGELSADMLFRSRMAMITISCEQHSASPVRICPLVLLRTR